MRNEWIGGKAQGNRGKQMANQGSRATFLQVEPLYFYTKAVVQGHRSLFLLDL
jgi:hypothetical protein